jgi:hypothetical protein
MYLIAHEVLGHGLGQIADEYMGNHIPDQDITDQPNTAETFSS